MKTSSEHLNVNKELNFYNMLSDNKVSKSMDDDTKKALLKTLENMRNDLVSTTLKSLYGSYSSELVTFDDIIETVDAILYGEDGGDASLEMLQAVEDFKREFSNAYLELEKEKREQLLDSSQKSA